MSAVLPGGYGSRPVRFAGTDAERRANRDSHYFFGDDNRCSGCDARCGSVSADYPCGASVPREPIPTERT